MAASSPMGAASEEPVEQILLVDDNPTNLKVLYGTLESEGYNLCVAKSGEACIEIVKKLKPALILLDIMMPPGIDGYETCRRLKADPETAKSAIIFLSALDQTKDKVEGFNIGAVDYISKPFQDEEVLARVKTHLTIQRLRRDVEEKNAALKRELMVAQELLKETYERLQGPLLGGSGAVKNLNGAIRACLDSHETILLSGAPGAGEEAVARAIHHQSQRRHRPFIHVNCAAVGAEQSEGLFGSIAERENPELSSVVGKFDLADGGTIYLDGVNNLEPSLQDGLLRVLKADEEARQTGAPDVDVRVIAFTSTCLAECAQREQFDEELFRLLSKRRMNIPPLNERKDDIPVLVDHFISQSAGRLGKIIDGVSRESMVRLQSYHWPGNIRELQDILDRIIISSDASVIEIDAGLLDDNLGGLDDIRLDKERIRTEVDAVLSDFLTSDQT